MLATEYLGFPVLVCFTIGIIAASFSNADSALTSITTSTCVDLLGIEKKDVETSKKIRSKVHLLVCILFSVVILFIDQISQNSILDTIYKLASYTYGPLLGLFFFGLFTKRSVKDKLVPVICILAPAISYLTEFLLLNLCNYHVGYEILLLNGLLTLAGLLCISRRVSGRIDF
jgi:Na+/proline symporter